MILPIGSGRRSVSPTAAALELRTPTNFGTMSQHIALCAKIYWQGGVRARPRRSSKPAAGHPTRKLNRKLDTESPMHAPCPCPMSMSTSTSNTCRSWAVSVSHLHRSSAARPRLSFEHLDERSMTEIAFDCSNFPFQMQSDLQISALSLRPIWNIKSTSGVTRPFAPNQSCIALAAANRAFIAFGLLSI